MKRLNIYIGRSLFLTTVAAICIVTFVMLCGSFLEMFELLSRGVGAAVIFRFVLYGLPEALGFALPLAVLVSTVTVFSRLSADQEITAMRASGVSLWQIISPALMLAVGVSLICLYLQGSLIPETRYKARNLMRSGSIVNPISFLEPGRTIQLPGCIVYVGSRDGNRLEDIQLYIVDENNQIAQDIHAARGVAEYSEVSKTLFLKLEQAIFGIVQHEKGEEADPSDLQRMHAESVEIPVHLGQGLKSEFLSRREKYQTIRGLLALATIYEQNGESFLPVFLQLQKRLVMGLAPVAFVLMGIPFGIRTRRSETVAGIVVSLILSLFFFTFIALADNLENKPFLHPEFIVWIPVIAYQIGGLIALRRLAVR